MNWEQDAYGTPTFPTLHDQPATPKATPRSAKAPTFDAAAFETPRSNLATFESFFPFSTSPLQPLTECDGHEPEPSSSSPPAQIVTDAESTPRQLSQTSAAATPTRAPSSHTSIEPSQENPAVSAGTAGASGASYTNSEEAVFSQAIQSTVYGSQPTSGSMTTHADRPRDSESSPLTEEQDDQIQAIELEYGRYSRRASRYSQFSPDMPMASEYPVSAPVTASRRSAHSVRWNQESGFRTGELDTSRSINTESRPGGSGSGEMDQISAVSGKRSISRSALPNSNLLKPTSGYSQVFPSATMNTEDLVEPKYFLEVSRSGTIATIPPPLNHGGNTAMRSFRHSSRPESANTVREERIQVERQTLKPRSNNGAIFSSTRQATSLIKVGHKRRCTEETLPPVRRHSIYEIGLAGKACQAADDPMNSVLSQRNASVNRRQSTRTTSIQEQREALEHPTVTFTIDENGRARAERMPFVKQLSAHRHAQTSHSFESGGETDCEDSSDSDFDMAISRNPSFTVMGENQRPPKLGRREEESWAHTQPSSASRSRYLDSHPCRSRLDSSVRLIGRRTATERANNDRVQARVRAYLLSPTSVSAVTDEVETEAETLFDGDEFSSDSDPDAGQKFETEPRGTGMNDQKSSFKATHTVWVG
ncbi:MAG: hypothetical protein M1816_002252 [Peltula sp. TS41687]|nr:MAG: hypothetical protein M1816_002252 [Peltula sp. TS41687]